LYLESYIFWIKIGIEGIIYYLRPNKSNYIIMKKNIGPTDKVIRIVIAAIIMALYYFGYISDTLAMVLLIIGIILLLTSLINFCPLYKLIGTNTCKKK